jgi:DNA invertase Pin-like site-specific DNA recombinase
MFISIQDNIDLSTSTGRLQFRILSAFAEFERDLISERTKQGLRRAKEEGKKLGRPRADFDQQKVKDMLQSDEYSYSDISDEVGISKSTISRFKKEVLD